MVTGTRAALSLLFQPGEERTDDVDIESCRVEPIGSTSGLLGGMLKEQLEGIAIGQNRVAASVTFNGQVLLEEILDECLQRGS